MTAATSAASATSHSAPESNPSCPTTVSTVNEPDDGPDESSPPELKAVLSVSETTVAPGTEVEFDASDSTGEIDAFAWKFGDESDPTMTADDSVTHTYDDAGEYVAVLAVRGVDGELEGDSVQITVTDDRETSDDPSYEEQVEAAMHDAVNEIRVRKGLNRLAFNDRIAEVARGHSRDMAENDFLDHVSSDGRSIRDRYQEADITCDVYAENVLYLPAGDDPTDTATEAVDNWMDSSGHREHILDERWSGHGIGVVVDDSGRLYATQNFDAGCE